VSSFLFHRVSTGFQVHSPDLTWSAKAARCTEIFAALTSSDGYQSSRLVIGSDPVVSNVCIQNHPSEGEYYPGTFHVFDAVGSSHLGFVPFGRGTDEILTI